MQRRNKRMAREFLKEAKSSENRADFRPRVNKAWMKGAELESVIQFLSH